jgi:hypothetical protein
MKTTLNYDVSNVLKQAYVHNETTVTVMLMDFEGNNRHNLHY